MGPGFLRRAPLALLVGMLGIGVTAGVRAATATGTDDPPSLIVLVVIDQFRPDYLRRYGAGFPGGIGRLYREGAVFLQGLQDHAITQTAPGHSTLLSGRSPSETGIITNDRGVPDRASPLLEVPQPSGASPHRFRGTALYDWLLARDPGARVLSVSRKDRSAILPVGRARGQVYWYSTAGGRFTTSRWYADSLAPWVRAWNARGGAARLAGTTWALQQPERAYPEPDDVEQENGGKDRTFPHRLPGPEAIGAGIISYPWMDSLTLDFALEGARQVGLGRRGRGTDLLIVSLSTLDEIGHDYGPASRETHDHLLRTDRWLGRFLDSLGTLARAPRMVVALSADHGISTVPELASGGGGPAGRIWLRPVADLRRQFDDRLRTNFGFDFSYGLLMADVAELAARGVDVARLSDSLARAVARTPGIVRVYTPRTLAAAPRSDAAAERWRRQIPAGTGWLFAAVASDTLIWATPGGFNHGSPRLDDRSVPVIVAGPGVRPGRYERPVRVQHLAATLAALAGVEPTQPIEGRPLPEVIRR